MKERLSRSSQTPVHAEHKKGTIKVPFEIKNKKPIMLSSFSSF
jgi:hypothetical protein